MITQSEDRTTLAGHIRFAAFTTGVLFPMGCFLFCGRHPPIVDAYQSGTIDAYSALLLVWPANGPMLLLISYSIIGLSTWLARPTTSKFLWVRLSVYTGLLLTIQYFILICLLGGVCFSVLLTLATIPLVCASTFVATFFLSKLRRFTILHLMMLTAVAAILLAISSALGFGHELLQWLWTLFMATCISAPVLALLTYVLASRRLWLQASTGALEASVSPVDQVPGSVLKRNRWPLAWVVWLTSWLAAWKVSVTIMMDEYAKLPTSPTCYLCGVAAHGYRPVTKSTRTRDGKHLVSPQLRQMKFLEIVLMTAFPGLHQRLRSGYDALGPPIAQRLYRHRGLATIGHLCLMPLQIIAMLVAWGLGIRQESIQKIYS